ncbi:MAG: flagellar motor switch protein FliG [Rhodobacteraceae bacterium]|nr:flagellar motor switch protein FliG [Paracoccaceae bacterium]
MGAPSHARLSKRKKAAVIVRLLLSEGVEVNLASLPDDIQEELTVQMSQMRFVNRATLRCVVNEFVSEIEDIGLSFPSGLEGALSVLNGSISEAIATRIRRQGGVKLTGNPWDTIAGLDAARLLPVLEEESTEIAAVLLSKLKVSKAAELLGNLPGKKARQIAYALSLTGSISPEIVEKVGRSLAEQLDAQPASAFADGPVERVGAILNFSPAATRDEVLQGLDEDDATFASEVRKAIFTFANIPSRIDPRDVPKITRDIDQAQLITALATATDDLADVVEFILGAMSKRMAEQLREEMENLGNVKAAEGEAAMNAVIGSIRDLEASGEILLIAEDE